MLNHSINVLLCPQFVQTRFNGLFLCETFIKLHRVFMFLFENHPYVLRT